MTRFCTRTLCLISALALFATPALAGPPSPPDRPIDLVLCLDVSNSMDGLIDSAKAKLWDVANHLARVQPTPHLRVALYSYGNTTYDPNKGWVRKEIDLTTDLDAVAQRLFGLKTQGGSEYVARVCRDAIEEQKWSEDNRALKIIFVCGNEPAAQDPKVSLRDVAETAVRKGIVVNTIFCGAANSPHARDWKQFADLSEGRFANIDQDGGSVAVTTPVDKELAELGARLNGTYCAYGQQAQQKSANQMAQDNNALQQGVGVAASRAQTKAGVLYRNADWDLVDRLKMEPKFDVKKVPPTELTEEMRKMTPEQREAHVKGMLRKREELQKQITGLDEQRQQYLETARKKQAQLGGRGTDQAFDEALRDVLRLQAEKKGFRTTK